MRVKRAIDIAVGPYQSLANEVLQYVKAVIVGL